jgi:uncharacterized protein (TIGR02118 family)
MIKWVGFIKRRPDIGRAEFIAHWRGPHANIARRLPGLRGYRINVLPEDNASGWDGFAELYFESDQHLRAALASDVYTVELPRDRPLFIGEMANYPTTEIVILAPQ